MYPTQAELKALLDYDPMTGDFTWLHNSRHRGSKAGSERKKGVPRRVIMVKHRQYTSGFLALLWMGDYAENVEYIDKNVLNDSYRNLRPAPKAKPKGNVGNRDKSILLMDMPYDPETLIRQLWITRSAA